MSKNVAVFVDVANIFYAAKAAGVDIDYVTLLRSATAGRDFVRAYAYTGLDPENENQRQFHAFLSRSGYKVVSKDIRKYGDGRVKANLDIELVVDMMRMAEKLDVAVVVSGDGDFAPAIRAVQQQGVRVEVISFRGNTSSDLIEVADVFVDIADVAKVEKGARSGRRVAGDGDLSMTEVPDKESGVVPRRRRRRGEEEERPERPERRRRTTREPAPAAAAAPSATTAGLVPLPGERLSRGTPLGEPPMEEPEVPVADEVAADERDTEERGGEEGGGRRRRRRRGGRGRGRGGRADELVAEPGEVDADEELASEVPVQLDEVPTLPQHSGFGSVWDSQIGMPAGSTASTARVGGTEEVDAEADLESEPEVPEYLLAEKRQQGRRRGGGRGRAPGRQGGYRSAIDRERYGVGGASGYSRGFGRSGGQASQGARPMEHRRPSTPRPEAPEPRGGGDPWSEVPPEVQELLRAELSRREAGGKGQPTPAPEPTEAGSRSEATASAEAAAPVEAPVEAPKPRRASRRKSPADTPAEAGTEAGAEAPVEAPKPRRASRRKSPADTPAEAGTEAGAEGEGEAPKPRRASRRKSPADTPAEANVEEG